MRGAPYFLKIDCCATYFFRGSRKMMDDVIPFFEIRRRGPVEVFFCVDFLF